MPVLATRKVVLADADKVVADWTSAFKRDPFDQSVLAMLAPWNVEAIGAPQRLAPNMVPALKLSSFTFTSISDAI